jgi:hypothetical protein
MISNPRPHYTNLPIAASAIVFLHGLITPKESKLKPYILNRYYGYSPEDSARILPPPLKTTAFDPVVPYLFQGKTCQFLCQNTCLLVKNTPFWAIYRQF